MQRVTLRNFLFTLLGAIAIFAAFVFEIDAVAIVGFACFIFLMMAVFLYRLDYLHPALAFLAPWSMILIFSVIPISIHSRPIDLTTYGLILATTFAWLLGCFEAPPVASDHFPDPLGSTAAQAGHAEFRPQFAAVIGYGFVFLYAFAALNIVLAGFVPIISLVTTGDSRYLEFGVPSVYGAFLSYANALGCAAFYVYLRSHRRIFLLLFLSVFLMHIALVTRQNIITLLVEAFVIRSLAVRRLSKVTVLWCVVLALSGFSFLGSIRSGDVKEIFGVNDDYLWIPAGLIWVYAYSYFNALNIDNMLNFSGAPYFDGFMLHSLLPTVLRPENTHQRFIEVESAATSSYIYFSYMDIGKGVVLYTFILGLISAKSYKTALRRGRFVDIATYGCLFFCALLSFFTDCWMYLPVIFQVVFFRIFHFLLFAPRTMPLLVPRISGA